MVQCDPVQGDSVVQSLTSLISTQTTCMALATPQIMGYKIVGDNIDGTINPRYMRSNRQTESWHYYHSFAVQDRIDFTGLSDQQPEKPTAASIDDIMNKILPSTCTDDDDALKINFKTYIGRVLITNCKFFQIAFSDLYVHHIPHQYEKEMAAKSNVV